MTLGPAYGDGVTQAQLDEKVDGPAGATDNAVARYSGTTGKVLKDSPNLLFDDTGLSIGTTRDPSAILDLQSASLGILPPRMTTAERDNISSPATGLEIFNITTGEPENFNGSVWIIQGPTPAETLAETLAVDNTTSGNDIVMSSGDVLLTETVRGNGTAGLLRVRGGDNSPIGGAVQIEGGGASTTGGKVQLIAGSGGTNGGNVELLAGEGPNNLGGSVLLTAGNGGSDDGSGTGGDIALTAGVGGFDSGDGGDINFLSGNAEGVGADSGSITIDTGTSAQASVGDVLLQRFAGSVGIGVALATVASAKFEIISATQGFLPPRMTTTNRDAISSPATGLEIYNTTTNEPEYFDGSSWSSSVVASLAETLAIGNTSGGTDLVMSSGDVIVSPAGATDTSGVQLRLRSGDGNGTGNGGSLNVIGGNGGTTGAGGEISIISGNGGSTSGVGGSTTIAGGLALGNNADGGLVIIDGGDGDGTGDAGVVAIQTLSGGNVGIGTFTPDMQFQVRPSPTAVGSFDITDLGTAMISTATDNGGDTPSAPETALLLVREGVSVESFANFARFDISRFENVGSDSKTQLDIRLSDGSLVTEAGNTPIIMSLRSDGLVTIDGERAARIGTTTHEIFTGADVDALATGGIITIANDENLTLDIKGDLIISDTRFVLEGTAELRITSINADAVYLYSEAGSETFISGTGFRVSFNNIVLVDISAGSTLIDITGATFNIQISAIIGWNDLGSLSNGQNFVIHQSQIDGSNIGFDTTNMSFVDMNNVGLVLPDITNDFITIFPATNNAGNALFTAMNADVGANAIVKIDPGIKSTSLISVNNNSATGTLFNTSGGTTGTFFSVADAAIALTTIDSVTDSSGVARFNFTVGPTMFVNQEVDVTNFVTETSYNQTGIITATGAGFFEVASIAFTADDATGDFSSNSVTMTEVSTTLVDGDTLVINTTAGTQYDGGATVYNQLASSFQINRTFVIDRAGTWDTAGIDQTDPRVLATNNPGFVESKYIATAFVNDNSTANGAIVNNTFTDMVFGTGVGGLVEGSTMERWKLINGIDGIFEYTGNEPFDGLITFDFTMVSTGGVLEFRFKWLVDEGGGFVDLDDPVEALIAVTSDATSISKTFPLACVKGCQIKPQITRNSGGSGITTRYATIYATQ